MPQHTAYANVPASSAVDKEANRGNNDNVFRRTFTNIRETTFSSNFMKKDFYLSSMMSTEMKIGLIEKNSQANSNGGFNKYSVEDNLK